MNDILNSKVFHSNKRQQVIVKKTAENTNESIKNTETILRNLMKFLNIDRILKTNLDATKYQLQQRKFKNINYLKYKPQQIKEQMLAIPHTNFKKSYVNAVTININIVDPKTWKTNKRKTSKTNIHEEPPTLWKKLELLYPAHT